MSAGPIALDFIIEKSARRCLRQPHWQLGGDANWGTEWAEKPQGAKRGFQGEPLTTRHHGRRVPVWGGCSCDSYPGLMT